MHILKYVNIFLMEYWLLGFINLQRKNDILIYGALLRSSKESVR